MDGPRSRSQSGSSPSRSGTTPTPNLAAGTLGFGPLSVPDLSPDPGSYDALAELFLGDGTLGPVSAPARAHTAADAPTLKLAGLEEEDAELVDEAMRDQAAGVEAAHQRTQIELVIVGHLPVLASAWVLQYAARRAETLAMPVALLRVQQGLAQLDLVGPGAEKFIQPEALGLDSAMQAARQLTPHWIIRDEQPDDYASEFTGLTVLTSADDSAVVACYRELKTRLGDDAAARTLRVGVLGSAPERAREACDKIANAAKQFLGRDVQIEDCGQKITSRTSTLVYRGECDMDAADIVAHLLDAEDAAALLTPRTQDAVAAMAAQTPMTSAVPAASAAPIESLIEPAAPAQDAVPEIVVRPYPPRETAMPAPVAAPVVSPAQVSPPSEPRRAPVKQDGTLARHIAGLRPLPTTCPYAKEVQLAVDDAGRLHGLVYAASGATVQSVEAASQRLTTVEAWAKAHRELLELGHPALRQTNGAADAIIGHLLTDRPKDARVLLDTHLKIHLLTKAGEQWVCVELN